MQWLKELAHSLSSILRRSQNERELSEELQFHLERQIERNLAAEMPPEEARYAALRLFGGVQQIKEECRDMRRTKLIETIIQDLRYGLRMLAKNPGVTAVVVLSLAIGVGANTAIFSLLNAVVLKALPIHHPEQLVLFSQIFPDGSENSNMSWPYFESIRNRNRSLSGVFAFTTLGRVNVGVEGKADLATGQIVTGGYFSTLGLTP